jgi:hypothetical protein
MLSSLLLDLRNGQPHMTAIGSAIDRRKGAVMEFSHNSCLYGSQRMIPVVKEKGLLRAIMLPFDILNRHRWSAPWEIDARTSDRIS